MADRTVYGLNFSENGWRMVDQGSCVWVTVPGADVHLQIREGQPAAIMGAFAADFNAYVEPLRDADSACWTATNSVASSNHLSGTAMDLNWNSHPFRVSNAGFNAAQLAALRELIGDGETDGGWYEGMIFWGNYWDSPKDAMHFQMGYHTYGSDNVARVQDFINRKIRADGFSIFRRGGAVTPPTPPPAGDQATVLARATGIPTAKAAEILPTVLAGLKLSDCTNVNRIAMWLAQMGHESASFVYTEEIAKNGRYAPYIGRTWIQITWDYNYRAFSQWCFDRGLVPTPDYFVQNYRELADLKWAGIGPAWYWTVARPQINLLSDARNLAAVTQAIDGGQNGAADRKARYDRALALDDQLLTLTTQSARQDELEELLMMELESWSIYATPGEPKIPAERMLQAIDAANHRELVENAARLGDVDSLARIARVAAGRGKYTDSASIAHAKAVLAQIEAANPEYIRAALAAQKGA